MNETITLTKNDIASIISSGQALHTDIGQEFIKRLKSTLGIEVVACYFDSSLRLISKEPKRSFMPFRIAKSEHYFLNSAYLKVYAKGVFTTVSEPLKEEVRRVFEDLLCEYNIDIPYPSSLTLDEIRLCGFASKGAKEPDNDVILPSDAVPKSAFCTDIEDFTGLALWHVLSNCKTALSRQKTLAYYNAGVYCGWDDGLGRMRHYIAVCDDEHLTQLLDSVHNGSLLDEMYETVKKHDKCNVLSKDNYTPEFVVWSKLSKEKRFELLRN